MTEILTTHLNVSNERNALALHLGKSLSDYMEIWKSMKV